MEFRPYAWVKCVTGESMFLNQLIEGRVRRRKEKKKKELDSTMRLCWCRSKLYFHFLGAYSERQLYFLFAFIF